MLPQDENETIISTKLLDEIEDGKIDDIDDDTTEQVQNTKDLETGLDKSFYTRSMDLKREDLILNKDENDSDDDEEDLKDDKKSPLKRIITTIIIVLVLILVGYLLFRVK